MCIVLWHVHTAVTSDIFHLLLSLPRLAPRLLCSLSPNCVGVWQNPWRVERRTELTGRWRLHSRRAWIKCSWRGPLLHFSGEIWRIVKLAPRDTTGTSAPVFSVCHPSCSPMSTVKPWHHKGGASGDQRLWIDTLEQYVFIHTHRTAFVHINKAMKESSDRCLWVVLLWSVCSLLCFLCFSVSFLSLLSLRIPLQWCPYGGMIF